MTAWLLNAALMFALQMPILFALGLYYDVFQRHNFFIGGAFALCTAFSISLIDSGLNSLFVLVTLYAVVFILLFIADAVFFSTLEKRGRTSDELLIASLGLYIVIEQANSIIFGDRIKFPDLASNADPTVLQLLLETSPHIYVIGISLVALILIAAFFRWSEAGAKLTALAENPMLFRTLGFNSFIWRSITLCIVTAFLVTGSIISANVVGAYPTMGFNLVVLGFLARLLGGPVYRIRFAVTALAIIITDQIIAIALPGQWRLFVVSLVLFSALALLIHNRDRASG